MNTITRIVVLAAAAAAIAGCGSHAAQQPPAPSQPAGDSGGSQYYQQGYSSGSSGIARKGYGDNEYNTGATVAEMEHDACSSAINNESNYSSLLEPAAQDDYMRGCLNAFRDHPAVGGAKPGPLNPYR
jgi:hypothetical protein